MIIKGDEQIYWNPISTFWSDSRNKKAVVCADNKACYYFVDYFIDEMFINSVSYPGKSLRWAEDCAENFTLGILDVKAS
jgi:hypothetical protein